jgi:Tfp pilus assembly protein PilE
MLLTTLILSVLPTAVLPSASAVVEEEEVVTESEVVVEETTQQQEQEIEQRPSQEQTAAEPETEDSETEEDSEHRSSSLERADEAIHEFQDPEDDIEFHQALCLAGISTEALDELGGCEALPPRD